MIAAGFGKQVESRSQLMVHDSKAAGPGPGHAAATCSAARAHATPVSYIPFSLITCSSSSPLASSDSMHCDTMILRARGLCVQWAFAGHTAHLDCTCHGACWGGSWVA